MQRPGGIKAGFAVTPERGTTSLSHSFSTAASAWKYEGIIKMFQFKWLSLCAFRNIQKRVTARLPASLCHSAPCQNVPRQMCRNDREFRPISFPEREKMQRDERVFRQCVCVWEEKEKRMKRDECEMERK